MIGLNLSLMKTAKYDKVVDIDLSKLIPMAATPHSPGNISTVKNLGEIKVDQVCIGSCTKFILQKI